VRAKIQLTTVETEGRSALGTSLAFPQPVLGLALVSVLSVNAISAWLLQSQVRSTSPCTQCHQRGQRRPTPHTTWPGSTGNWRKALLAQPEPTYRISLYSLEVTWSHIFCYSNRKYAKTVICENQQGIWQDHVKLNLVNLFLKI
jgi:hypothetical protein